MPRQTQALSIDYLRECFDYDPETGVLRWKARPRHHFKTDRAWRSSNTQTTGKIVGANNKRARPTCNLDDGYFYVYRICFAWYHGYWPIEVDHRDLNTRNNRIDNLRAATSQQNKWNTPCRTTNVHSGLKGVHAHRNKWYGRLMADGKSYHTKYFATKEEARKAYAKLAAKHHGQFRRHD